MKNQIKELRVKIDGLAQLTRSLKPIAKTLNTAQIEESIKSLLLAKAWLGKMLGELGNENPYGSGYKTKEDIVPTQDVAKETTDFPLAPDSWKESTITATHIEKVDWLRQEIQTIIKDVSKWYTHTQAPSREFSIARTNSYNYLCEARFWLGFELERLKNKE